MDKIETLTPQQEREMIAFREQWRAIGMATGKTDREVVTPVIHEFYRRVDKSAPQVWYCDSPLQIQLVLNLLRDNLWDNLGDNLWFG